MYVNVGKTSWLRMRPRCIDQHDEQCGLNEVTPIVWFSRTGTLRPPALTSQVSSSAPAAPASVLLPVLQPRTRAVNM